MIPSQQIRVSATEREPVVEHLKRAYAEGRLDKDEFDHRLDLAMECRTRGELAGVIADLPIPSPYGRPARYGRLSPDGNERLLGGLAHASAVITLFLGPLVMLFLVDRKHTFARTHIKTALNFQLCLLLVTIATLGIGSILYAVAWVVAVAGGVVALSGHSFRYPWVPRLIR